MAGPKESEASLPVPLLGRRSLALTGALAMAASAMAGE